MHLYIFICVSKCFNFLSFVTLVLCHQHRKCSRVLLTDVDRVRQQVPPCTKIHNKKSKKIILIYTY